MANFSKWNAKQDPRTELHDVLGLTGAEISINNLPQARVCLSYTPIRRMRKSTSSCPARAALYSTAKKLILPPEM